MSDELVAGASELARRSRRRPDLPHVAARRRRGQLPAAHRPSPVRALRRLGVLGPHVLVAHAVHLDDDELDIVLRTDTAVASCPWAYLRLAQGITAAGRHGELVARGARIALGCDSENAGDAVDILRAARCSSAWHAKPAMDPFGMTAHDGSGTGHDRRRPSDRQGRQHRVDRGRQAGRPGGARSPGPAVRAAEHRSRAAADVGQRRPVGARRAGGRASGGARRPVHHRRPGRICATRRPAVVTTCWPGAADNCTG